MRVWVEAYGCAQSHGEGAEIARDLARHGHPPAASPRGADLAVLVTCGVIEATEARMLRRWRALADLAPRVVVTGCLVPLGADRFQGPARARTTFLPIREQAHLPALLADGPAAGSSTLPAATLPPPAVTEEVVIAQGCTSGCAYCFSRLARGTLSSVPADRIVERVRAAVARGAREIRLTGLDTAAWGLELPETQGLPELVRLVAAVDGDFAVRVGMMSPQTVGPILDRYLAAFASPKVYRFVHLPVQSGSDPLLAAMHRGYTVADFRRQVGRLRDRWPDATLATDVIVGFPGETDDDHRATEALLAEIGPETVNVTRYSARPGTPAAHRPPLPARIAKERSRSLTRLRQQIARARLERWIGRRGRARVVEYGPRGTAVARLENYLPVVLSSRPPLGVPVDVRIDGARASYLLGHAAGGEEASNTRPAQT